MWDALAPEGRALGGITGQRCEALLLEGLEPLARPALTLGSSFAARMPRTVS